MAARPWPTSPAPRPAGGRRAERDSLLAFLLGPIERHFAFEDEGCIFPKLVEHDLGPEVQVATKQHDTVRQLADKLAAWGAADRPAGPRLAPLTASASRSWRSGRARGRCDLRGRPGRPGASTSRGCLLHHTNFRGRLHFPPGADARGVARADEADGREGAGQRRRRDGGGPWIRPKRSGAPTTVPGRCGALPPKPSARGSRYPRGPSVEFLKRSRSGPRHTERPATYPVEFRWPLRRADF